MAAQAQDLISEECWVAINHVSSFRLHISDAYLSMACYYNEERGESLFAVFFEDQPEVKREHAKQFLRYLRKREGKVCLPVIKRPDTDNWGTGMQALESALELEKKLTTLLQDLRALASDNDESALFHFIGKYLDKQKRNTNYLERQITYHKELEKQTEQEDPFKKPASEGPSKSSLPMRLQRKSS